MNDHIYTGDALAVLRELPACSVQMCVTSPPYYGLRDYQVEGQIGLEETPELFVDKLVQVFREVRRVLRQDGVLWLNLGDSHAGSGKGGQSEEKRSEHWQPTYAHKGRCYGLKPKDLIGIPWMTAFALRADGWYLRSDCIWNKPACMPESVEDRPTKSHEYLFLLAKCERYYYDHEAIKEPAKDWGTRDRSRFRNGTTDPLLKHHGLTNSNSEATGRNKRSVWTINPQPYSEAHFATFPPKLIEPCILAGSRPGDIVLDCFMGAGTTALVALQHSRHYLGIELNPAYVQLAEQRISAVQQHLWTNYGEDIAG